MITLPNLSPNYPTSLRELLAYLHQHPRVRVRALNPGVPQGERLFNAARDGGLWFTDDRGQYHYTPVNCGLTSAESGVTFRPDGFDVTKFGVTIHVDYLD
jgi:hypothetical protein